MALLHGSSRWVANSCRIINFSMSPAVAARERQIVVDWLFLHGQCCEQKCTLSSLENALIAKEEDADTKHCGPLSPREVARISMN